jgi:hypothetical protein
LLVITSCGCCWYNYRSISVARARCEHVTGLIVSVKPNEIGSGIIEQRTMIKNVISRDAAITALSRLRFVGMLASTAVTVERSTRIVKLALRTSRGTSSVVEILPGWHDRCKSGRSRDNLINGFGRQRQYFKSVSYRFVCHNGKWPAFSRHSRKCHQPLLGHSSREVVGVIQQSGSICGAINEHANPTVISLFRRIDCQQFHAHIC